MLSYPITTQDYSDDLYPAVKTQDNILYEQQYYLIKETKKPTYLNFYELDDTDFSEARLWCYLEQTIRYREKWFFVTTRKQYFGTESDRDAAPKMLIKYLYRKPISLREDLPIKREAGSKRKEVEK